MSLKHLVFYDGQCGLCDSMVRFVLKADKKKQFCFAPLQGKTATGYLPSASDKSKQTDSLIFVENYQTPNEKVYLYGLAVFRIAWLLGGKWACLGWLCYLPSGLYDWAYRLLARNRQCFTNTTRPLPDGSDKERFLP